MTVTFTAATAPAAGFVVTCGCDEATAYARPFDDYRAAQATADQINAAADQRGPLPGCCMPTVCPEYPLRPEPIAPDGIPPLINVSNTNAVVILEALGLPTQSEAADHHDLEPFPAEVPDNGVIIPIAVVDAYGELIAEEFLGRVLTALALAPEDAGVPDIQFGRTYLGGRPTEYLQQRLHDLHELASWCATNERRVVWY
ncbi:hypothetical protein KQH21_30925 [Streptomyces sp. IpFD-1.1]|uniref:hypothetical protein n=1 Tax=unclassified Streptomyces TaxID=2593676 RepID=UPI001436B795|nr:MULTISPECIES: hypothetical protein [unclassified Streptomyces]MBV7255155.1 hypothetical protein [Streptomyces sp. S-2]MCO6752531.1 hypothetical protein [Streptomyces sp. IpFD-1.1]